MFCCTWNVFLKEIIRYRFTEAIAYLEFVMFTKVFISRMNNFIKRSTKKYIIDPAEIKHSVSLILSGWNFFFTPEMV